MATETGAKRRRLLFKVRVLVEADDAGFHAWIPMLQGLHASGKSVEQARQAACELAIDYLEVLIEDGEPIPVGPQIDTEENGQIPNGASAYIETIKLFD